MLSKTHLQCIRNAVEAYRDGHSLDGASPYDAAADDRAALLAEVDRLLAAARETTKLRADAAETQATVSRWAEETFGPASSNARVAARANEEMAELLRALTANDAHPKASEEIADVVIVLYRLATLLGVDLHAEVDRKMQANRTRQWRLDGSGHGYHVREKI